MIDFGDGIFYDPKADKFHYSGEEPRLTRPLTASYQANSRCNHDCGFCCRDGEGYEPTTGEIFGYLDAIASVRPIRTSLSGGEIFIRDDAEYILAHGKKRGNVFVVITNGSLMNPSQELANYVSLFEIGLDGPNQEIYRAMRGGDFHGVCDNIRALRELGANVRVTYLVTRKNFECAREMPELCSQMGVDELRLQRFHASGRGLKNASQYAITEGELAGAVEETRESAGEYGIEMLSPLAAPNCFGNFSIGPEGEVFFSYGDGSTKNKQRIGNLKDATLQDLWRPDFEESHRARIFAGERL